MFENKMWNGVHYSRYIASWIRVRGNIMDGDLFMKWLKSIGVPENIAYDIWQMGTNGKLELQTSAMKFLKGNKK